MEELTEEEFRKLISQKSMDYSSDSEFARVLGIKPAYLSMILSGKRTISDTVAKEFGYTRVVVYRKE